MSYSPYCIHVFVLSDSDLESLVSYPEAAVSYFVGMMIYADITLREKNYDILTLHCYIL